MNRRYLVTGPVAVLDADVGEELEHEFTAEDERDHLDAGRLTLLPREYRVVGSSRVHETEPGKTFKAAVPIPQEAAWIEGGHVELVEPKKAAAAAAKSNAASAAKEV